MKLLIKTSLSACFVIALSTTAATAVETPMTFDEPEMVEQQVMPSEPIAQCARLVNDCYGEIEGQDRANCLFSSAKHPFCEGTSLGKVAYQRWIMSPAKSGGEIEPGETFSGPSFLGPKIVNQECLKSFDTRFVSSLLNSQKLAEQLPSLQEQLTSCTREETSPELSRP